MPQNKNTNPRIYCGVSCKLLKEIPGQAREFMQVFLGPIIAIIFFLFPYYTHAKDTTPMTTQNAHSFSFTAIDGTTPIALKNFAGKVLLVVNTASMCGFTKQYSGLQELHENFGTQGLVVIGVPANDFGQQEPGSNADIQNFCQQRFNITFPLMSKEVVTGDNAHPFYQWASAQAGLLGRPKWNFHKYLIGKNGEFIDWFASTTAPTDDKLLQAIEKALAPE